MLNRRRFLSRSAAGTSAVLLGMTGRANDAERLVGDKQSFPNHLTAEANTAIDRGLAFLANTQNRDGSFGDNLQFQGNLAVTALSALALMAGGHMPGRGAYGKQVLRALQYVLGQEQSNPPGFLYNPNGAFRHGPMYSHGFATLFLAEVYGMVPDLTLQNQLRGTIDRAVQVIINSQNSEGGWRYEPIKQHADSSVTICQIMALRAARNVGFFVPKEVADKCVKYIRSCQTIDGGFSYYAGQGAAAFARSAAGVVALFCAGIYSGPEIERGLRYLLNFKPNEQVEWGRSLTAEPYYYYGQYYASQAMWTAGPRYWNTWFPATRDELLRLNRNRTDGAWTDQSVCSHYATAMACIILQIPNNYLPILQK